jgi:hypothetical protein
VKEVAEKSERSGQIPVILFTKALEVSRQLNARKGRR